jgi:hypothetical protein
MGREERNEKIISPLYFENLALVIWRGYGQAKNTHSP